MEQTKKSTVQNTTVKTNGDDGWGGGCPWWIFGNEQSAENDLKDKFNVIEDEED